MQELKIRGGRLLKGRIHVSGAKNAALPALAACILVDDITVLHNMPDVRDVTSMCQLLESLGASVNRYGDAIHVDTRGMTQWHAPHDLVRKMRASVLVMGPLIARFGRAEVALPGGCTIGNRPIDLHINALRQMGAEPTLIKGEEHIICERLIGARIHFDRPTVTGTENVLMAATAAEGETVLENAAREPEVADLAHLLVAMGAQIEGIGTDTIRVSGGRTLHGADHSIISDRIEAGTYAIAAAMTGGDIVLESIDSLMLTSLWAKMTHAGVSIREKASGDICVSGCPPFAPVHITTAEYPGFPTDLQAQFMAMMCLAKGESVITENIFEDRFKHASELNRMGADIVIRGRNAFVKGIPYLSGAAVTASDLRASASLVIAGLAARDETRVLRIYHLDRGYERIDEKLACLGADIKRVAGEGP
ncbi:UDP-N-acetylglucosamine 1-carboxyvinyltransferase [bacterium]|nr:UDP-N-acetylglucosamine 1-carboxyvinyltransferase [candidate division CSSED10-310 bacterium]